ncbi:MAG: PLP-dependent aminotransferase family protein [Solirubrobacterales bacterium]
MDAASLYSDLAQDGPPLFFPDPPAPVTFNLDQGIPDEATFPVDDLKRLAVSVLDRDDGRALEYISFGYDEDEEKIIYLATYIELVLGYTGLREELAKWMSGREGRELGPDNFILASGSVQAIALAINAFVNPGDGVLLEAATFPYAMRYMQMRGADVRSVAIDADGIDVDDLERQILEMKADGVRPKLMYVIPTFQLPTCVVTPLERRKRLLELAAEHEIVVLEDNIYGDLRYEGEALPTLLSLDRSGLVIQSHGFSKIVAPALRIGWVCGDPKMIEGLAAVRQDLGVSQWLARIMTDFMREGKLDPHIAMVNDVYRRRRDVAVAAVREHCGEYVRFEVPHGGFYLWLELDERVDWDAVGAQAAENGVMCRPGEMFMGEGDSRRFLRLAYSHAPDHELVRGIEALGKSIRGAVEVPSGN